MTKTVLMSVVLFATVTLGACGPTPKKCVCPSRVPMQATKPGQASTRPASGQSRGTMPRPATGAPALRIRFAVDENFLVVHAASYYYKGVKSGQRGWRRWRKWRRHLAAYGPRLYRRPPRRPFITDTKPLSEWVEAAKRISALRFHTLRGSRSIGKLPNKWSFWTPQDTTDQKLDAYQQGTAAYVRQLKQLPMFKTLLAHTKKRLQFCRKQWTRNLRKSYGIMRRLTGMDFRRCYTVYITYPGIPAGKFLGKKGPPSCPWAFLWGAMENFPNYTTVYLWHELLHGYFGKTQLDHALIQLLTDNELRVRLNGGRYPPFFGHGRLVPHMLALLPAWRKYLRTPGKRDIRAFLKQFLATGGFKGGGGGAGSGTVPSGD